MCQLAGAQNSTGQQTVPDQFLLFAIFPFSIMLWNKKYPEIYFLFIPTQTAAP